MGAKQHSIPVAKELKQVQSGTYVGGVSLKYIIKLARKLGRKATMADLVNKIIKPKTNDKKESYLELLARTQPNTVKPVADYFVSYVWAYNLKDELLAALQHTLKNKLKNSADDVFVWLDLFCINQHMKTSVSPEQLQLTFSESLKAIGSVIMVLSQWYDPEYAKRIWCVFEAYVSKRYGVNVILAMSKREENSLVYAMLSNNLINRDNLAGLFGNVDVESAKARELQDQEAILHLIREYGITDVNSTVLDNLKQWLVQVSESAFKMVKQDSKQASNICASCSTIYEVVGELEVALEWAEKVLDIDIKLYGTEYDQIAADYSVIVSILKELGRFDEALVAHEKDYAITVKLHGVNDLNTFAARSWKGELLLAQGKFKEALVIFDEILQNRVRLLGEDVGLTKISKLLKATCLRELKQFDEALVLFDQVIESTTDVISLAERLYQKSLCLQENGTFRRSVTNM
jgi:tetratricopeptide (TPR) repeat protein